MLSERDITYELQPFEIKPIYNYPRDSWNKCIGQLMWLFINSQNRQFLRKNIYPGIFYNIHSVYDELNRAEPEAMTIIHKAVVEIVKRIDAFH